MLSSDISVGDINHINLVARFQDIPILFAMRQTYTNQNQSQHSKQHIALLKHFRNALQWRHNEHNGVSNHQRLDCLLNSFFQAPINENIKAPRHWPLWGEFTGDLWIPRIKSQ